MASFLDQGPDLGPEDPELLKMSGSTVLEPMEEGKLYADMPLPQATAVLKTKAILALGPERYRILVLVLQALFVLFAAYLVYKIFNMIRSTWDDPAARRVKEIEAAEKERKLKKQQQQQQQQQELEESSKKKNNNKSSKNDENNNSSATNASSSSATASSNPYHKATPQSKRSRDPTLKKATSSRPGYDLVSACVSSPDANLLVLSERSKRTLTAWPQHKTFVPSFRSTLNLIHCSTSSYSPSATKPLVTSVHFSPDSRVFSAFDVGLQSLMVYRSDANFEENYTEFEESSGVVTFLYKVKVSEMRGLAAISKGQLWGTQFATHFPVSGPDRLYFFQRDGQFSIYSSDGTRFASAKRSLGNFCAWGVSDGLCACSGSMMTETTLHRIKTRTEGAVTLEKFGPPSLSPPKTRLSHLLFAADSSMVMMLPEEESAFKISFLYGVDLDNAQEPKISIELEDSDFLDSKLRSQLIVELYHFAPNPTYPSKKVAFVSLRVGGDIVVYRIDCFEATRAGGSKGPNVTRVLEVHGAHGDSPLIGCALVGRGRGICTAAESDANNQIKCWEIVNKL